MVVVSLCVSFQACVFFLREKILFKKVNRPMIKITAVIITFNEALHIHECLKSLDFVDQIIVVDSGSTDETREIIKDSFPYVHLIETKWCGYSKNKKLGIEQSHNAWILWID